MSLPIFPLNPLPGGLTRTKNWNESVTTYDSGVKQGDSNFVRPLFQWTIPVSLFTEIKQSSLWAFYDTTHGMQRPFLLKDAYDYRINSVFLCGTGFVSGSLYIHDVNSYMVRADTTTIGSLFSSMSGYVTLGSEFTYDQDTGIMVVNTKATNDVWSVRSAQYYKKGSFTAPYQEISPMWNVFQTAFTVEEWP